jgi:predicted short-subunit dehydrogenase-like oxidoreductase (DUF2520 family)
MTDVLNIVGCGRVGRTLGRLWHERGTFAIGGVLTRHPESAAAALHFIGAGRGASDLASLPPAAATLIATGDDAIAQTALELADAGHGSAGQIFFHCSGALASAVLAPLRQSGATVASVHPVKSFADPGPAAASFAGTWCGIEGDSAARERISPAFESIGARLFPIDPDAKTLYHAGAVLACSYLVPLIEASRRCFAAAGVPDDVAACVLEPLASETLRGVLERGGAASLTGPIARGDDALVRRQLESLTALDPELAELYRSVGRAIVGLSRELGEASPDALLSIQSTLETR